MRRLRSRFSPVQVHRWYAGLETSLERIERTFGSLPTGGDWHLELLAGAALDVSDVRPPIAPQALGGPLREVLRFRHFFRHAYSAELDAEKLRRVAPFVRHSRVELDAALERFEAFLREAVAALGDQAPGRPFVPRSATYPRRAR